MTYGAIDLRSVQSQVRTVTDTLGGGVGGVAVDGLGTIYVADFGETVYKIRPDGRVSVFATGLYGSSGNAVDSKGNLLQANFAGNYISRIDRHGHVERFAEGFSGPVGIAAAPDDDLYVCNCSANTISHVSQLGEVSVTVRTRSPRTALWVVACLPNTATSRRARCSSVDRANVLTRP